MHFIPFVSFISELKRYRYVFITETYTEQIIFLCDNYKDKIILNILNTLSTICRYLYFGKICIAGEFAII